MWPFWGRVDCISCVELRRDPPQLKPDRFVEPYCEQEFLRVGYEGVEGNQD